jgi:hypothetical protein
VADHEIQEREAVILNRRILSRCIALMALSLLWGCGLHIGVPAGPGGALPNPVKTIAGSAVARGSADGVGTAASFNNPQGIVAVGSDLYIIDTGNASIRRLDTATNAVTTFTVFVSGTPSPHGIASDGTNLYVADTDDETIRQVALATGVETPLPLAGLSGNLGSANGAGPAARFFSPYGIVATGGNLYLTDTYNHTIRQIVIATAAVSTFAGTAGASGSANGVGAAARFFFPCGIPTDGTSLYVTDYGNSTIRKVDIATASVTTIAGQLGVTGSVDGTGLAAAFNGPMGLATDGTNLYIADTYNCTTRQMVLATAAVTTVAGLPGIPGSVDGGLYSSTGVYPIPPALTNHPAGIALIGGSQYLADGGNNAIREIQ